MNLEINERQTTKIHKQNRRSFDCKVTLNGNCVMNYEREKQKRNVEKFLRQMFSIKSSLAHLASVCCFISFLFALLLHFFLPIYSLLKETKKENLKFLTHSCNSLSYRCDVLKCHSLHMMPPSSFQKKNSS